MEPSSRRNFATFSVAVSALLSGAAGLFFSQGNALANPAADSPPAGDAPTGDAVPAELRGLLPAASLSGRAKLSFLGLSIYNASLWVSPDFKATTYDKHSFALELAYLRNFTGDAIAKRSISEMRRQGPLTEADEARWEPAMRAVFPDVKPGDRIMGIHRPGTGATFLINGVPRGDIRDTEFSRLFFGIWLSGASSEPKMRALLLRLPQP